MTDHTDTTKTFEDTLASLQTIVEQLETGNLPLAETIARFEEGTRLAASAHTLIEQAELRITVLTGDTDDDEDVDPDADEDDFSDIPF